jgi:hypothetical protein
MSSATQIETVFATMAAGAPLVGTDGFFTARRDQTIALAARNKLPAIYGLRDFVVFGGLMSYGADFADAYHQAGIYTAEFSGERSPLTETAKSRGCDLFVMSSHGHRGLSKLFLGSQTSEVLADGSVPVLVVHSAIEFTRRLGTRAEMEVRMLQISVTICANHEKVMEEARRLEREGIAKIGEHIPTLTLNVPDHRNEEMVIAALARLTRKGFVTDFKSERVNK